MKIKTQPAEEAKEVLDNLESVRDTAYNFWFNDHEHVRTPFPAHMHGVLRIQTFKDFRSWTEKIRKEALDELNMEILIEKFEEILFEIALKLAKTEDEKITIRYPFLPRLGDKTNVKGVDPENAASILVNRKIVKDGDLSYLEVCFKSNTNGEEWITRFELPE